jgi:hypothetical protein
MAMGFAVWQPPNAAATTSPIAQERKREFIRDTRVQACLSAAEDERFMSALTWRQSASPKTRGKILKN